MHTVRQQSGRPGCRESYWGLACQRPGHTVLPGSHRQNLCPSLKMKVAEPVEPKTAGSFSAYTQVEQQRAPSLQLTQNNDDSWQTNLVCTCLSSVDVESFSSNLCSHQVNCFCILNFDSVFFKYANIVFLTAGIGLMWGWADCLPGGLRGEETKAVQQSLNLYHRNKRIADCHLLFVQKK